MKAISLKPPWPYAIFHLSKDVENRTWYREHYGPTIIHASRRWDEAGYYFIKDELGLYVPSKHLHAHGALVGTVNIYGIVKEFGSKWFFGPYGYLLKDPEEFKQPIPYRGERGFFEVADETIHNR